MTHHPFGFTFDQERATGLLRTSRELAIVSVITTLLSGIAVAIFALTLLVGPADAKVSDLRHPSFEQNSYSARSHRKQHVHQRAHHRRVARHHRRDRAPVLDANGNRAGLVTVATAAGIEITVAASIASKMQGFIRDMVARGYHPHKIHCYNLSRSHVPGSLHFRGEACDFDQRGWGLTSSAMYHVADLARVHGLRDGCSFHDCGHIDSGQMLARAPWPRTLSAHSHHHRVAMIGRS
jgi:hypothetical protein